MSGASALRLALIGTLFLAGAAQAQLFRAYLASDGADTNPCTLPQPCRLLPAALNQVAHGGEVWILDSANYNLATVTIDKSVSILAVPGAVGSIVAYNGGPAIRVSADSLAVGLRNLVIAPLAGSTSGTLGVEMTGNSRLVIENCLIANLNDAGVYIDGPGRLKVSNTTLRNNNYSAIWLRNGARGTISSSQIVDNIGGVMVQGTVASTVTTLSVSDSVISGPGTGSCVRAHMTVAATARVSVSRSTIERCTIGLESYTADVGTAEINVGSSMIVDNLNSFTQIGFGSSILTLGNSQASGNPNSVGTVTPLTGF